MTPSDKEFGELIGEMRGLRGQVTDLHGMVSDLQRSNAQEHAANGRRLDQMWAEVREGLAGKAESDEVDELRDDVEDLKLSRARNSGRDSTIGSFFKGAFGAAVTILVSWLFGHPIQP